MIPMRTLGFPNTLTSPSPVAMLQVCGFAPERSFKPCGVHINGFNTVKRKNLEEVDENS